MATEVVKKRRKRKVNKSLAIKEYINSHPEAGPTEVARVLTEQGIKITPTHVSNVKARLAAGVPVGTRGGGAKKAAAGKPSAAKAFAHDQVSLAHLLEAKKMVDKFGSIETAQHALSILARLG